MSDSNYETTESLLREFDAYQRMTMKYHFYCVIKKLLGKKITLEEALRVMVIARNENGELILE